MAFPPRSENVSDFESRTQLCGRRHSGSMSFWQPGPSSIKQSHERCVQRHERSAYVSRRGQTEGHASWHKYFGPGISQRVKIVDLFKIIWSSPTPIHQSLRMCMSLAKLGLLNIVTFNLKMLSNHFWKSDTLSSKWLRKNEEFKTKIWQNEIWQQKWTLPTRWRICWLSKVRAV